MQWIGRRQDIKECTSRQAAGVSNIGTATGSALESRVTDPYSFDTDPDPEFRPKTVQIRIRIRIQSEFGSNPYPDPILVRIQSNPDPGVLMTKNWKKITAEKNFFLGSLGLHKGRLSY